MASLRFPSSFRTFHGFNDVPQTWFHRIKRTRRRGAARRGGIEQGSTRGIIETPGDIATISLLSSNKEPQTIKPDKPTNLFVEFLAALDAGKPWPIPAEDCVRATEIVLLGQQAAEERAVLKIPAE